MSLENIQGVQNQIITKIGNVSASNDPKQIPADATETLIKGAELAAAGKTLGMSEEETLAAVSRQYRRQSRADQNLSQRDVLRQMVQSQSTLTTGELKGIGFADTSDEDYAFGQSQDDYQNFSTDDYGIIEDEETGRLRKQQVTDERPMTMGEVPQIRRRKNKRTGEAFVAERDVEQPMGYADDAGSATGAMKDALNALEAARGEGDYSSLNKDGINAADVAARLEAQLDPRVRRDNDRAEGANAVRRSNRGLSEAEAKVKAQSQLRREFAGNDTFKSPIRSMPIDARAVREAEIIAGLVGPRTTEEKRSAVREGARREAERALIFNEQPGQNVREELASLGKGATNFVTVNPEDANRPQIQVDAAGQFVDERGAAVQDPFFDDESGTSSVNKATSSNGLNAPKDVRSWIELNRPEFRESSSSFGNYPQVDITQETTNFANKVRHLGQQLGMDSLSNVSPNVRTTGELQSAVDAVIGGMSEKGKTFYMRNPETGKNEAVSNPGVAEVMQKLRMTSGDTERLANAMYQMDAARRSGVNQNANQAYDTRMTPGSSSRVAGPQERNRQFVNYDSPEAVGGSLTPVAQAPFGSKVEGKDIRSQLAQLPSDGAATPFIGQVQGESPRINRFKPGGMGSGEELERNLRRQAISRAKPGEKLDREGMLANITKARLVEERDARGSSERVAKMDAVIRSLPPSARSTKIYNQTDKEAARVVPEGGSSFQPEGRRDSRMGGEAPARDVYIKGPQVEADLYAPGTQRVLRESRINTPLAGLGSPTRSNTTVASQPPGGGNRPPAGALAASPEPDRSRSSTPDRAISKTLGERAQSARQDVGNRINRMDPRARRGLTGAAIAGGITAAGKGLYDVTRPEEEETLMVRYS